VNAHVIVVHTGIEQKQDDRGREGAEAWLGDELRVNPTLRRRMPVEDPDRLGLGIEDVRRAHGDVHPGIGASLT